jgi:hypothetical protein
MKTSYFASIVVLFFLSPGYLYGNSNVVFLWNAQEQPSRNMTEPIRKGSANLEVNIINPSHSLSKPQNVSNRSYEDIIYEIYATIITLPLALLVLVVLYLKKKI